jgi:hypothetical protein
VAKRTYMGFLDGKQVAKANDLKTLAKELRAMGVDPRQAEIWTEPKEPAATRMGLRTRASPR